MDAAFHRRLGKSPEELGTSSGKVGCPDLWELTTGDVAVIGRDCTEALADRLPPGAMLSAGERIVVVPRVTLLAAKSDMPAGND